MQSAGGGKKATLDQGLTPVMSGRVFVSTTKNNETDINLTVGRQQQFKNLILLDALLLTVLLGEESVFVSFTATVNEHLALVFIGAKVPFL